jgi:hypothetical protein
MAATGPYSRPTYEDHSACSLYGALGKGNLALDLKTYGGQQILWRLVRGADAFIEGFRPGTRRRRAKTPSARCAWHRCGDASREHAAPHSDRVNKLLDYAARPSLRGYVLLEQTAVAATVFRREPSAEWIASAHTGDTISLPGLDISLLSDLYRGLTFAA